MTPECKALAELVRLIDEAYPKGEASRPDKDVRVDIPHWIVRRVRALSADTREEARPTQCEHVDPQGQRCLLVADHPARHCYSTNIVAQRAARPSAEEALPVAQEPGPTCDTCGCQVVPRAAAVWFGSFTYHAGCVPPGSTVEATPPARDSVIEECAKVCDGMAETISPVRAKQCAAAIRALKEKP